MWAQKSKLLQKSIHQKRDAQNNSNPAREYSNYVLSLKFKTFCLSNIRISNEPLGPGVIIKYSWVIIPLIVIPQMWIITIQWYELILWSSLYGSVFKTEGYCVRDAPEWLFPSIKIIVIINQFLLILLWFMRFYICWS